MLDSIYHITFKLLKNHSFSVKTSRFCHLFCNIIIEVITLHYQICNPFLHGIISLPVGTSCDKVIYNVFLCHTADLTLRLLDKFVCFFVFC